MADRVNTLGPRFLAVIESVSDSVACIVFEKVVAEDLWSTATNALPDSIAGPAVPVGADLEGSDRRTDPATPGPCCERMHRGRRAVGG